MRHRRFLGWVAISLLAVFLAVPGWAAEGEVVVGLAAEPTTLDSHMAGEIPAHNVDRNIYDSLLARDANGNLVGSLAESWKALNDTTWQFKLRRGIKFHNGEEFDAEAVKFNYERVLNPEQKARGRASIRLVDRVEVVDKYTVNIHTSKPFPVLLARNTYAGTGSMVFLPPKYVKEKGDAYVATHPVGTGPFKFVEWVKGSHIRLEANPDWWKGKPKVKGIVFRAVPEASTRIAGLLTGDLHLIENVPPDQIERIEKSGVARISATSTGMINPYFQIDTRTAGPVQDKRVRQAVNYAVDMDSIIKFILRGQAERRAIPLDPRDFGFDPNIKPYPYDPAKAKQLLAEAGYPNGFEFTMNTSNGRYVRDKEVSEAVAAQLAKVGIPAKVQPMEWGVYLQLMANRKAGPMYMIGWGSGLFDADVLVDEFHSTATYATFNNPKLDSLLDAARVEMNPEKRKQLFWEAQQLLHDEAAFLATYEPKALFGVSNKLNWEASIGELIFLWDVSFK